VLVIFSNATGDSAFDDSLRQGLSVELEQSPFLSIVPDAEVHRAVADDAELRSEVDARRGSRIMPTARKRRRVDRIDQHKSARPICSR